MLPTFEEEHVRYAIKEFNRGCMPTGFGPSNTYDLVIDGSLYPPKVIVHLAHKKATGIELSAKSFQGSIKGKWLQRLRTLGFEVRLKSDSPLASASASASALVNVPEGELHPEEQITTTKTYARSDTVKSWVLARAKGSCESCAELAPFMTDNGEPYLEVHHIKQLAHGGSDRVSNTVALCPNCHRQFHFGKDKNAFKEKVLAAITELQNE